MINKDNLFLYCLFASFAFLELEKYFVNYSALYSRNYGETEDDVTNFIGFTNIFAVIGCLLAIVTIDKWNKQLQLLSIELIIGVLLIIFPFIKSFKIITIIASIIVFLDSFLYLLPLIILIEMFKNTKYFVNFIQFIYFLQSIVPIIHYRISIAIGSEINKKSKYNEFLVPILVIAFIKIFIFILISYNYKTMPYKKPDAEEETSETNDNVDKKELDKSYSIIFLIFICILVGFFMISNRIFNLGGYRFTFNYISKTNKLGHRKIADTLTYENYFYLMSVSQSIFILFNMILTLKHKIEKILILNFVSIIIGWILLRLAKESLSTSSLFTILIGSILISFGHSSFIALIIGFMEKRIKLNTIHLGILNFSNFYFLFFYTVIFSLIADRFTEDFAIGNIILIVISFIFYCTLIFLEKKRLSYENSTDI